MDTFADLDFPNMLGNRRARASMPACCVCGRLCGGARYRGYRYRTEIKQENFYSGSLYQALMVGAKKQ